jgi:hypothetical protein
MPGSRITPCYNAAIASPPFWRGGFFYKLFPVIKPNFMQVLIFKTNLNSMHHIRKVEPCLNVHPYIHRWNVDLHDCDNILRIETENLQGSEIENLLINAGYYCEELY